MKKNTNLEDLLSKKNEISRLLYSEHVALGHEVLKQKEKNISKENIDIYASFNTEVKSFYELQDSINALDKEHTAIKEKIADAKDSKSSQEKSISSMYVHIGELLFENYVPSMSDVFGKAYTQLCVEDRKIEEAKLKEESRESSESTGFFSRLLKGAVVGASKTQVSILEKKREHTLVHETKLALESKKLESLLEKNILGDDVSAVLNEYHQQIEAMHKIEMEIETLVLNENAVKTALEKAGAALSVQRRISAIDKQIAQKKDEQDEFCSQVGHDFAIRYVSPDGDTLVDFAKETSPRLVDIQKIRKELINITREIEIEKTRQEIETVLIDKDSLQVKKEANMQSIEKLQSDNESLDLSIKEKNEEQQELEKKLAQLEKEGKASKK